MGIELKHAFCLNILFGQVIELRGRHVVGHKRQSTVLQTTLFGAVTSREL